MSADSSLPIARPAALQPATGILLLLGAVACFSCIDSSAKWLNRVGDPWQTVAVRYLGSFLLVSACFNPWTRPGLLRTRRPLLQCGRALCLVVATLGCFFALRHLPLTKLTSIIFAAPLIVALLAGPLLGETIGPRRALAVLVGFAGILVVTRPFGGGMHPAALLALLTAGANALYSLMTRKLAAYDPPETTMFYTGLVGTAVTLPLLPWVWTTPTNLQTWLAMGAIGTFGALGHWLLILAHRHAPSSMLAPYFYAQIVTSTLLGWVIFHELPDRWTLVGAVIVIGSGLYLFYRERVRQTSPSADVAT